MTRLVSLAALALLTFTSAAVANDEPDELIPAKVVVVKSGLLVKFVAKPPSGMTFNLPDIVNNNPTIEGATLRVFDTSPGGAGDVTFSLASSGWSGLGNPAGTKGYKYKGSKAMPPDATCKVALIKPTVIKAVCKGSVALTTPFSGNVGIILTAGTDSKRYCASFGGENKKNDLKLTKRKGAPPPPQCPEVAPTATPTDTLTPADTATMTSTPTDTATPADTATQTNTPTAANTSTATSTVTVTNTAANTPTVTATFTDTVAPTATNTPLPACPLTAGKYTLTQQSGGTLQVASIGSPTGFPFPSGGTVVQDVLAGTSPACVHDTIVPASGGFFAPVFCIPGLNFSVKVTQDGCGVGRIDSNGGSDFTIVEIGDTSDNSPTCNLPAVGCPPGPPSNMAADRDSSVRVDITVGNGAADTCPGGGTANALVAIPVETNTWLDEGFACPDPDGVQDGGDTPILLVKQILDFTTDVTTASWSDIDGDGCSIAGAGPASGLTRTGICLNIGAATVTTAAAGTIGSDGSPLFDLTFATRLPNSVTGPAALLGATCPVPPIINFTGAATRCIP